MTLVSENIYIDKLPEAIKEYNSSIYATFKIITSNCMTTSLKFKVGDYLPLRKVIHHFS